MRRGVLALSPAMLGLLVANLDRTDRDQRLMVMPAVGAPEPVRVDLSRHPEDRYARFPPALQDPDPDPKLDKALAEIVGWDGSGKPNRTQRRAQERRDKRRGR